MKLVLAERNRELITDVDELLSQASKTTLPQELEPCRSAVEQICKSLRDTLQINLAKLQLPDQVNLVQEIISDTGIVLLHVRLMSESLIPALIQNPFGTHLSLKILVWLHQTHHQTRDYPPVVGTDGWGVLPLALPIYYVPLLQQNRLLQQPLLFHEFGHKLYGHHKPEMDQLVKELQHKILRLLRPSIGTNDPYYDEQMVYSQNIAFTWYRWIQELFCDAVGFRIGGPSFVKAFSASLSQMQRADFYLKQEDLIGSSHPVTWLRVHFLTQQARNEGLEDLAQQIDITWSKAANTLGIVEDYYGVYDEVLQNDVLQTLEYMLIEADPVKYQPEEKQDGTTFSECSPIWLLNRAWTIYESQPSEYPQWEKTMIEKYLKQPTPSLISVTDTQNYQLTA